MGGLLPSKRLCLILQPCLTSFSLPVLLPLPISPGRASVINPLLRVGFWESQSKSACKNNHTLKSIFKRWQLLYSCCSFQINSSPSSSSSNREKKVGAERNLCLWNLSTVPLSIMLILCICLNLKRKPKGTNFIPHIWCEYKSTLLAYKYSKSITILHLSFLMLVLLGTTMLLHIIIY